MIRQHEPTRLASVSYQGIGFLDMGPKLDHYDWYILAAGYYSRGNMGALVWTGSSWEKMPLKAMAFRDRTAALADAPPPPEGLSVNAIRITW